MPPSPIHLFRGAHAPDSEMCLMESVARAAGEDWSDHPQTACPVLAAYGRTLNDWLDDESRQRLVEFIPLLIGSRSTPEVELRRAYLFADTAVRRFAPFSLRAVGLDDQAAKLESLPEINSPEAARAAKAAAEAAAKAAKGAAEAAAAYAANAAYAAAYAAVDATYADATAAAAAKTAYAAYATYAAAADAAAAVGEFTAAAGAKTTEHLVDMAVQLFRDAYLPRQ